MNYVGIFNDQTFVLICIVILLLVIMFLAGGRGMKRFCLLLIGFAGAFACVAARIL